MTIDPAQLMARRKGLKTASHMRPKTIENSQINAQRRQIEKQNEGENQVGSNNNLENIDSESKLQSQEFTCTE